MTDSKRRLKPRHALALAGVLSVFGATVIDLGWTGTYEALANWRRFDSVVDEGFAHAGRFRAGSPDLVGTQRLRGALWDLEHAALALDDAEEWNEFGGDDLTEFGYVVPSVFDRSQARAAAEERRAKAWPAYLEALDHLEGEATAGHALEPDNGVFEAVVGLSRLDRVFNYGPADPRYHMLDLQDDEAQSRWQLLDPVALEEAVQLIERGLERGTFTFHDSDLMRARAAEAGDDSLPSHVKGMAAMMSIYMPELMFLKQRTLVLANVAQQARLEGRPGRRYLQVARRLSLRLGAEAQSLIGVFVADAMLRAVDVAWLGEAAATGDAALARAASEERSVVEGLRHEARNLAPREGVTRLGVIDSNLMPTGGWRRGDPSLGRLVDYSVVESGLMWGLQGLLLLALPLAWVRRAPRSEGQLPAAGWTVGDLLHVVLPSVGAGLAIMLCYSRLHPMRQLGVMSGDMPTVLALQALCFLGGITLAGFLLFVQRVLAKHGLGFARPGGVRTAMTLGATSVVLGLGWVGPFDTSLAPLLGLAIPVALVVAVWGAIPWATRRSDPLQWAALRCYSGRVGLACLGAALCLVAAVNLTLVVPRRTSLLHDVVAQVKDRLTHEAESWGDGEPQAKFRELLSDAPDHP